MAQYVCGFDGGGKFLVGCLYKNEATLARPKMLNSSVVFVEVVYEDVFNLYRNGYKRGSDGKPVAPIVEEPTDAELAEQALIKAKADRTEAVNNITVEVDGLVFDGDEVSQERMARSVVALEDGETIVWVLHDNTVVNVTKEQLKMALRLAGQKQTLLWTRPYEAS